MFYLIWTIAHEMECLRNLDGVLHEIFEILSDAMVGKFQIQLQSTLKRSWFDSEQEVSHSNLLVFRGNPRHPVSV